MAKYPAVPKPWVETVYGGNKRAWEEAKAQCRDTLLEWAREGRSDTYTALIRRVTAIEWPEGAHTHAGRQIGMLLGQVALEELDEAEDRPLLSTLVVSQETNKPSTGYWNLLEELGVEVPPSDDARDEFWVGEASRALDVYGRR